MRNTFSADNIHLGKLALVAVAVVALLAAFGWMSREDPAEIPYLRIAGKSFIFNYRVADAHYGFAAYLAKTVPKNSVIIAEFEDPQGGQPFVVSKKVTVRSRRYGLRSPALHGVKADTPYSVRVRLLRFGDDAVLHDETFTVSSQISSDVMPEKALTVGPGYHPNPELRENGG